MEPFVPRPARGRTFSATRRVRLGDVETGGRLRLDALARYLQDIGFDDGLDAGLSNGTTWVLRRVVVDVERMPRFGDLVTLTTWCGGVGSRWAERRTSLAGPDGAHVEVAALWVFVDDRGRPARIPADFEPVYGEAAGGRRVTARLSHPGPPPGATRCEWAFRRTDCDLLGHVNNASYWAPVEEWLAGEDATGRWEVEYRDAVEPGARVEVLLTDDALWVTGGAGVHASVRREPSSLTSHHRVAARAAGPCPSASASGARATP